MRPTRSTLDTLHYLVDEMHHAQAKPVALEAYRRQLYSVLTWSGVSDRLNQIAAPSLVIQGETDPLVPYANGQYLAAHILSAKLLIYLGVGHSVQIEAAEHFNRDVIEFLS